MSHGKPRHPVIVLISGRGSNMRSLIEASRAPGSCYDIVRVLSDQPAAPGLGVAQALGVATQAVPADRHTGRETYDRGLARIIDEAPPALIVLAGFMRILSAAFVDQHAGRIINIHPSLLPAYPGLHTHRRVLAAGDLVHGATVHFVTAELDGGPRIIRSRVPVLPDDDEAALAARVRRSELRIYPLAVRWFAEGRLRCDGGHAVLDDRVLDQPVLHDETAE